MTADPGSGTPMSERMQALLSRAVEDQLSEQRQVQGALTEVRNLVGHLSTELQQLRATAGGAADEEIQRQVAGVAGDVREAIRVLSERMDGVSALVQQRGHDLAELRNAIDSELRPRVESVDAAIRDLRGAFTGIGSRVAELPARHDVEGMIARARTDLAPVDERLEQLQGWVEEVHAGLFGDDGVHPRVQALVEQAAEGNGTDDLPSRIDEAVRTAVAASERRITAHVDEAVLALAEALLRRRSRTGGVGLSAFDTGPIPTVPANAEPTGPQASAAPAAPEVSAPPAPDAPRASAASDAPEASEAPEAPGPGPSGPPPGGFPTGDPLGGPGGPGGPVQSREPQAPTGATPSHIDLDPLTSPTFAPATVPGAAGVGHDDLGDDDEAARRRRPWWRPGD
ncbi:MAG TPA: hypothetical protein VFJ98_01765 [Mycobacteriales bacterium]|nr:hypothetical protein [Mycobacteriales bacterium]